MEEWVCGVQVYFNGPKADMAKESLETRDRLRTGKSWLDFIQTL